MIRFSKRRLLLSLATYLGIYALLGTCYCLWRFVFHSQLIGFVDYFFTHWGIVSFEASFKDITYLLSALFMVFIPYYFLVGWVFNKKNKKVNKTNET